MGLKTIEEEWEHFYQMTYDHVERGSSQYKVMREVFYAGAFTVITAQNRDGATPEYMQQIDNECQRFFNNMFENHRRRN